MNLPKLGGLLHQISKTKDFKTGVSLHAFAIKMGFNHNLIICNHLINMYSKCDNSESARKVFDGMPERNLVSWSALISGYNQAGKYLMAIHLFTQMRLQPNEFVYASILSSCASLSALIQGKQVHAHALISGYNNFSFVSNSVISMYMKCGCFDNAFFVFINFPAPNLISYNAMLMGFADNSQLAKGLQLFKLMNHKGLLPDQFSYVAVLKICTQAKDLDTGLGLHCQTAKLGLDTTAFVGNVILTMYSQCGKFEDVEKAFNSVIEKDVVTCNTYIAACSHCGENSKGLRFYREMGNVFGVDADDFTLASAMSACAALASIRYGAQIHAHLIRTRECFDIGVGNAIINMYAKCGSVECANHVFNCLPNKNVVSFNTMIVALGNHGLGRLAIETFEQLKAKRMIPNSVTFIGILSACGHSGLVDAGLAYFDTMMNIYGIPPNVEHLSCLIDMLGRSGRLEEAQGYVRASAFENDSVIWGSLLSSCRLQEDLSVGERVGRRVLELEPSSSSPYVLLSNLYASDGRWDKVAAARKLLKSSGMKKEPGSSLIAVRDIAEKFIVGDFSHVRIAEVVETLRSLQLMA